MGNVLPVAAFATADLPPHVRYDAWRNLISSVFAPSPPSGRGVEDFRAGARSVHLGQALVVRAAAEAQHFTRSRRLIAVESLDHYLIQVYRHGVCEGTYGEVQNTVRPGDIKLIDLAQPFHTLNTDFDNITLTIPRAALAPLLAQPDRMHGRVLPHGDPMARVIAAHIRAVFDAAGALTPAQGAHMAAATARLMAACLGANPRSRDETLAFRVAAIGQTVRDYIDQQLASPLLEPELLARRFNMSRAQLYRLFEDEQGVAAYIRARRLHRCFVAITDPAHTGRAIGEIALGYGFNSEAHFSRLFRRTFGMTPSEARAGAISVAQAVPFGRDAFINDWMRALQRSATPLSAAN